MDNLEYLSDEELRLRLLQYGYQNLPITQTTRKILITKLRNAMKAEKSKVRGETSMATSFSSGEESDTPDGRRMSSRISGRPSTASRYRKTVMAPPKNNVSVSPLLWGGGNESDDDDSRGFNGFSAADLDRSSNSSNGSLTDCRKRLMALRSDTLARNNDLQIRTPLRHTTHGITSPNEIVCHAAPEPETPPRPLKVAISNLVNKLDECYGVKQTFVPCILVSVLIIFFIMIACMYLTISPNIQSTIDIKSTVYKPCASGGSRQSDCFVSDQQVNEALDFIRIIIGELQRRAEANRCGGNTVPGYHIMTLPNIMEYLKNAKQGDKGDFEPRIFRAAQLLITQNPQWGIQIVKAKGEASTAVGTSTTDEYALEISHPVLPYSCIIKNKLRNLVTALIYIIAVAGILLASIFAYRCIQSYTNSRKQIINGLINEITSAVIEQATKESEDGAVIVNHLRDKLIPIYLRKERDWAWLEAIRFIEENESRIQFEVGSRNGEDFRMMRWVDTSPSHNNSNSSSSSVIMAPSTSADSRTVKTWQSPAFDKSNKIKDPPTPCLKIRQMFDKYDANDPNLKQVITDAILAKVGNKCHIYDVRLDQGSCCVYVRCATNADAGIVHDEINGWWFASRLVSIKFLRLERYLARFPAENDTAGSSYLKPTSYASIATPVTGATHNGDADDDDIND